MDEPEPSDHLVTDVISSVNEAGGLTYARQRALALAQEAERALDGLPASPARDALRDSIAYAVERRS
jgi:octaprenyl-diphosphate synthase